MVLDAEQREAGAAVGHEVADLQGGAEGGDGGRYGGDVGRCGEIWGRWRYSGDPGGDIAEILGEI
jgi:hypothetical protein